MQHLIEGGIYFKVRRVSSIEFENVIFIFLTKSKLLPLSYIVLYISELLVMVIVSLLVYLLQMHFNLVTTKLPNFY